MLYIELLYLEMTSHQICYGTTLQHLSVRINSYHSMVNKHFQCRLIGQR